MTATAFDDVLLDWCGEDRPHLAGWTRSGKPIFHGTQAQWRARFDPFRDADTTTTRDTSAAWIAVARRVLAGEFDDADDSTVKSLTVGLRSIQDSVARQAWERLRNGR